MPIPPERASTVKAPGIDYDFFALNLCLAAEDVNRLSDRRDVQAQLFNFMGLILKVQREQKRLRRLVRAGDIGVPADVVSQLPEKQADAELGQRARTRLAEGLGATTGGMSDKEANSQRNNVVSSDAGVLNADARLDGSFGSSSLQVLKQNTMSAAKQAVLAAGPKLAPRVQAFVDYQVGYAAKQGVNLASAEDTIRVPPMPPTVNERPRIGPPPIGGVRAVPQRPDADR